MRINSVSSYAYTPHFGDALSTKQEVAYQKFLKEVEAEQGFQNGFNVVKIDSHSIPSSPTEDTGIGKIDSKEADRIYDFAKVYYNASGVKIMPLGPLTDKQTYNNKHYTGAYNRGALSIGEDTIDPFALTRKEFGCILPKKDALLFAKEHKTKDGNEKLIDYETTLGWKNEEDYPINKVLKTAYKNFKNNEDPSEELIQLRKEFEAFKKQKKPVDYDDIYTRLALFPILKNWEAKVDFFRGFDSNPDIRAERMPEYNRLKKEHKEEIEFFKFKQFLGHKTLEHAKEKINSKGMDAMGDCIIGFSWPESQVFPDAFVEGGEVGWGLPAINFYDLRDKDDSAAHRLLRTKVAHYLTSYDGIRFDVGWQYMNPKIMFKNGHVEHLDLGTKITDYIEDIARDVKGNDFDQRKLMYECDADYDDFGIQKWEIQEKVRHLKGLAILSTENEHNEDGGWGNMAYIRETLNLGQDDTINGTNTHDGIGVYGCATDSEKYNRQIGGMMRTFHLREEDGVHDGWRLFKDDENFFEHVKKYFTGRFAEITTTKNNFIQFFDMLGKKEKVDYHTGGDTTKYGHEKDYKNRLERNWEENYHRNLQKGMAFNAAEAHKFRMEHDGTKERRPDLYQRACKWSAYLQNKGGLYTKAQADKSSKADLNIEKMSMQEIRNLNKVG